MIDERYIINYGKNNKNIKELLKNARDRFGSFNQILVSIEELNELSSVIAKIPRYKNTSDAVTDLHDKILDEVADSLIVLDHIINICNLVDTDIEDRIYKKMIRMKRWLDNATENDRRSLQQVTLEDRDV